MKRLTILLFALCLCTSISAQIQTKFWGLELGNKYYNSVKEAQAIISTHCEFNEIEGDAITAFNGSFGGYEWRFVDFSFIKGTIYYSLFDVTFSHNFSNYESAKKRYDSLCETLNKKYGIIYNTRKENNELSDTWSDNNTSNRCLLRLHKEVSKGGETFWYVDLSYWNGYLLERAIAKDEDEL